MFNEWNIFILALNDEVFHTYMIIFYLEFEEYAIFISEPVKFFANLS